MLAYADRVMQDRHSDTEGTVTITVPPNLIEALFQKTVETFQLQYPKASLRILVSERMLDFIDDGVDLSFRVAPPRQPDLVVRTLLKYRHRIVSAPSYAAIHSLPRSPAELALHKRIGFGFNDNRTVTWALSKPDHIETTTFEPNLAINDYAAIQAAISSGQGIGELPEPLCQESIRTGRLIEVLPDWNLPQIQLLAVHTGRASLPKLARLFLDIAAEELKSLR